MEQRNTQEISLEEFAQKYLDFFEHTAADDREMYGFLDDMTFPDECWRLGFEMDCGHSFIETCGEDAWRSVDGLQRVVDSINDVKLLGSAIFSQWRYFNHWAGSGLKEEDREWFIVMLRRLKQLSEEKLSATGPPLIRLKDKSFTGTGSYTTGYMSTHLFPYSR